MQGFFITAFCENLNPGGVIFEKGETSLFSATEAPCHVTWVPVVHPAELHIGTNETKGEHKTRKDTEPISSSTPCKKHLIHVSVLLNRMCWGLISAPRGKGHSVAHIHAAKPWRVTWPIVSTEKDLTPHLNTQAATGQENAHWHRGKPGGKACQAPAEHSPTARLSPPPSPLRFSGMDTSEATQAAPAPAHTNRPAGKERSREYGEAEEQELLLQAVQLQ